MSVPVCCGKALSRGCGAWQEESDIAALDVMLDDIEQHWARRLGPCMRVAVLAGGPGLNREASLEHARTVVGHLDTLDRFEDGAALPPSAAKNHRILGDLH